MRGLSIAALVVVALAGCLSSATIELEGLAGGKSAVLFRPSGEAWAVDLSAPPTAQGWPARGPVFVATYPWTLDELGLSPGRLPEVEAGRGRMGLAPGKVFEAVRDGDGWRLEELPAPEAALEALRLPTLDDAECLVGGGCRPVEGSSVCLNPCPAPNAPAEPNPPRAPCPEGWAELAGIAPTELTWCAPTLPPADLGCPPGEVPWYDVGGCAPVDVCPAGAFRDPGAPAVYVRAGASGGDGTEGAPYGRLADALDDLPAGGVIALGEGSYTVQSLDAPVRLVGRCASSTRLVSLDSLDPLVDLTADGIHLEHLTVQAGLRTEASAQLEAVHITQGGLRVRASTLRARRLWIQAIEGQVFAAPGGALELEDLAVEGGAGIECRPGAEATVRRAWVRDATGGGIVSRGCLGLVVEGALVDRPVTGLRVLEDTVTASVSDFAVRGASGAGLLVDRGPVDATAARVEVTLRRISIEGARWGVEVLGGASISLRDLHVTDADSWGLRAQSIDGPTLAVRAAGIWALRTGGFAFKRFERSFVAPDPWIIEDAIAIAPHDAADDTIREGVLRVTDAATVEARRLYLGPGKEIGVVMRESTLRLEDITVQGPRVDGLELRALGPTTVTRAVARDVPGVGFTVAQSVNGGALVTLRDVRVRADADSGGPALGIVDESNTGLDLARFFVAGTSLGLGVKAATRAREGALTDCALGVRLAEGVAPGAALSGVHIGCTRALEGP